VAPVYGTLGRLASLALLWRRQPLGGVAGGRLGVWPGWRRLAGGGAVGRGPSVDGVPGRRLAASRFSHGGGGLGRGWVPSARIPAADAQQRRGQRLPCPEQHLPSEPRGTSPLSALAPVDPQRPFTLERVGLPSGRWNLLPGAGRRPDAPDMAPHPSRGRTWMALDLGGRGIPIPGCGWRTAPLPDGVAWPDGGPSQPGGVVRWNAEPGWALQRFLPVAFRWRGTGASAELPAFARGASQPSFWTSFLAEPRPPLLSLLAPSGNGDSQRRTSWTGGTAGGLAATTRPGSQPSAAAQWPGSAGWHGQRRLADSGGSAQRRRTSADWRETGRHALISRATRTSASVKNA